MVISRGKDENILTSYHIFKNQKDESLKCQKENLNTFMIKVLGFSKVLFFFLVFRGETFLRYKKII